MVPNWSPAHPANDPQRCKPRWTRRAGPERPAPFDTQWRSTHRKHARVFTRLPAPVRSAARLPTPYKRVTLRRLSRCSVARCRSGGVENVFHRLSREERGIDCCSFTRRCRSTASVCADQLSRGLISSIRSLVLWTRFASAMPDTFANSSSRSAETRRRGLESQSGCPPILRSEPTDAPRSSRPGTFLRKEVASRSLT